MKIKAQTLAELKNETKATKEEVLDDQLLARRKLVVLLATHLQNFKKAIITMRRRSQQRIRRRQTMLRSFNFQARTELESCFMECLPSIVSNTLHDNRQMLNDDSSGDELVKSPSWRFYENAVANYNEAQWLSTFRMSRARFKWLCAQLSSCLPLEDYVGATLLKLDIPLEKRIALALYAFTTGEDYRSIALLFNVSRSLVCKFIQQFAAALLKQLGKSLIAMPKGKPEYEEIRTEFRKSCNMPAACVGVLGICRIARQTEGEDLLLEVLIDDRLLFRKVIAKPQRLKDFLESPNVISRMQPQLINKRYLPCFVVTPPKVYPLRLWLMQQYAEPVVPHEYDFNEAIDHVLGYKDKALQRLFARWRILERRVDVNVDTMESITLACCALHNLLEELEESFLEQWRADVDLKGIEILAKNESTNVDTAALALKMRDFLARTISSTEI